LARRSSFLIAALSCFATHLFAGYAASDSWLAVAGQTGGGAGGRAFYTTVYLTDVSLKQNDVKLSFYASAQPNVPPREMKTSIGPNQTAAIDIGPQLTGEGGGTGALHIESTAPLLVDAHVFSRAVNEPAGSNVGTVITAIPSQFAIGTAESTLLHVPAGARYRIYAAETRGFPLYFSAMTLPGPSERRLYLSAHEQRSWDLDELFRGMPVSSLRISGVNGSGKIVVAGTSFAEVSQDFSAWEMSLRAEPRNRLRFPELIAYLAVALALTAAAVVRLKTRGPRTEDRGPR
jgi:hypothetical protein